jgi:hypothetical protein
MRTRAVRYVFRMFPRCPAIFVANEVLELERMGFPLRLYSGRCPDASVPHENVRLIRTPIIPTSIATVMYVLQAGQECETLP